MPLPSRSCKNTSLPLERVLYSHPFSVTSCPIWPFNSLIYVCFISTSSSYMLAKGRFYLKGWAVQKEVVVERFPLRHQITPFSGAKPRRPPANRARSITILTSRHRSRLFVVRPGLSKLSGKSLAYGGVVVRLLKLEGLLC